MLLTLCFSLCFAYEETAYERGIREEIQRRHEIALEEKKLEVIARLEMLTSQGINVSTVVNTNQRVKNKAESEATSK
jgi:hypothetical protein